ncbi:MAG TPA: endolytic transglycosylase MltG [Anaerolineae bacterium]
MANQLRKWGTLLAGLAVLATAVGLMAGCSSEPALSAYLDLHRSEVSRAADPSGAAIKFTVEPGSTSRGIAQNLQNQGLIKDAHLFEAYVRASGLAGRLQAGTFTLSPAMTPAQIAEALQHARAASLTISIPEGWRLEQTADYLDQTGALDGAEYRHLAADPQAANLKDEDATFLSALPAGASLEGYLFPDTYEVPAEGATAADLIRRQLDNFQATVLPLYEEAFAAGRTHLGLPEVVTLASIVEREAVVEQERPTIAGVYLNRLNQGMRLEADPTVQYAMGYQAGTHLWWKTPVSLDEYGKVASPYNTYLHAGLPPGPIASPGLASIKAVLAPDQHKYLYFVALPDGSGRHVFAQTFAEHQKNVQKYRGQ